MDNQPFELGFTAEESASPARRSPTADLKHIFLEIKTHDNLKVRGESIGRQSGYHDLIVVDSWSWGVAAEVTHTELDSFAQASPRPDLFGFRKSFDSSSPTLLAHASRGKTFRSMLFHVCKSVHEPGGPPLKEFLTIRLDQAFIANVRAGGEGASGFLDVSVAFDAIRFLYHKVDADGHRESTGSLYEWHPQRSSVTLDRSSNG